MKFLLVVVCLIAATPMFADPCQSRFRAGLSQYARFDTLAALVEDGLFVGMGWVSVPRVLARLENRSAMTSACDEVAVYRSHVEGMTAPLQAAAREFRLAAALCSGRNRERAHENIQSIEIHNIELADLSSFVGQLTDRCAE